MNIRHFQPGDEHVQAALYNAAASALPGFQPAKPDDVVRRYRANDPDPTSKFYAVEGNRVVGYVAFNPNGRISYPWCLPEAQDSRALLLDAALSAMRQRGFREAWAAYRADWLPVLDFLKQYGFRVRREMINYVSELPQLPREAKPDGNEIAPLARTDVAQALDLGKELFHVDAHQLEYFLFENPYFDPSCAYTLKRADSGQTLGVGLAITDPRYADPTKVDATMPCFRLGAMGTETERHKRINGLFSCVFASEAAAVALLAEAVRRFQQAGLTHAAAQAPSDRPELVAFYDRYFRRKGSFPILFRAFTETQTH